MRHCERMELERCANARSSRAAFFGPTTSHSRPTVGRSSGLKCRFPRTSAGHGHSAVLSGARKKAEQATRACWLIRMASPSGTG
jgi:hypothetical protein